LPPGDARHPAIVFLDGCGGLTTQGSIHARELAWAAELNRLGYAVLMLDSFAPRNLASSCSLRTSDATRWFDLLEKREKDARGALRYLQSQPYVQPDRIGVIGWSQGVVVVLMLVNASKHLLPAEASQASLRAALLRSTWPYVGPIPRPGGMHSRGCRSFSCGICCNRLWEGNIESWVKQNDGGMTPYRALSLPWERHGGRRVDLPSSCPHGLMPPREGGKASQPQCRSRATAALPAATSA
jgi:hypothetical protein